MGTELVSELTAAGVARNVALKAAISAKGIRQYDVAAKVGISDGELSKLLSGRRELTADRAAQIEAAIAELAA